MRLPVLSPRVSVSLDVRGHAILSRLSRLLKRPVSAVVRSALEHGDEWAEPVVGGKAVRVRIPESVLEPLEAVYKIRLDSALRLGLPRPERSATLGGVAESWLVSQWEAMRPEPEPEPEPEERRFRCIIAERVEAGLRWDRILEEERERGRKAAEYNRLRAEVERDPIAAMMLESDTLRFLGGVVSWPANSRVLPWITAVPGVGQAIATFMARLRRAANWRGPERPARWRF